jgi:hypothetical protein
MADAPDPNAAPMHHEIVERFAGIHVAIALLAGVAATVLGIVLGLVLVND